MIHGSMQHVDIYEYQFFRLFSGPHICWSNRLLFCGMQLHRHRAVFCSLAAFPGLWHSFAGCGYMMPRRDGIFFLFELSHSFTDLSPKLNGIQLSSYQTPFVIVDQRTTQSIQIFFSDQILSYRIIFTE